MVGPGDCHHENLEKTGPHGLGVHCRARGRHLNFGAGLACGPNHAKGKPWRNSLWRLWGAYANGGKRDTEGAPVEHLPENGGQ